MASRRSRLFRRTMRLVKALLKYDIHDFELHRRKIEYWAGFIPLAKNVEYQPQVVEGIHSEWITPENAREDNILYYLHGGGYIVCSINTHRRLIAKISQAADIKAFAINYRLAPEHPFPAAVEDACTGYLALLDRGYKPENIIIGGDSAGGGLTIASMVSMKEKGIPLPAAAFCLSPWTDMEGTGHSNTANESQEGIIYNEALIAWGKIYAGKNIRHPLASPIHADLFGLPPLYTQVGTSEILLDDAVRLHEQAVSVDVESELDRWTNMFHVWQVYDLFLPEARSAIKKIGSFIKTHV